MATKRVWIDGQCFQTASNVRGIGRYVAELLCAVHARGDVQLIISLNGNLSDEAIAARRFLENLLDGVEIHIWFGTAADGEGVTGFTHMRHTDGRILVNHINALKVDVALSPSLFEGLSDLTAPLVDVMGLACPTACIFHDAIPHRFPERYFHHPEMAKAYYRRLMGVGQFNLVLCNSEFTAHEFADIFGRHDGVSIAAGLATSFAKATAIPDDQVQVPFQLPTRYILHVGGLDWRKNISGLISAMALLPDVRQGKLSLVLAGGGGKNEVAALRAQWELLGLPKSGLITASWITDAQLVKCYRRAALAVQPSLMEGFGLAALEAMTLDCPFIAARGGAVGEVVGNPAQLFDGTDPKDIANLIERVLTDTDFCASIVAAGKQRTPLFEWRKSAEVAISAIDEMLADERQAPVTPDSNTPAPPRIVMDVTATAQSPMHSGIQRVMRRLSAAMISRPYGVPTVLSYSDNPSGWYQVSSATPDAVSRSPLDRLSHGANDIHLMLDSSWGLPDIHRQRLTDALLLGQQVVQGVHDIGPLTMPAMTVPGMPAVFSNWFKFILGYSTGIICVSRATADEVDRMIRSIKLPRPMKIGYVQLGADFTDGPIDDSWFEHAGAAPTFLMVGTIEPRKGHALVLDAFDRHWAAGGQARLMLVGKPGWNTRLLKLRLQNHPQLGKRLHFHTNVTDSQLRGAYANAQALIMASYLEGFGLPVVEAGRLGCPAILSDLPVFREVAEGAVQADFFPSGDVDGLLACIERSLEQGARDRTPISVDWPDWHGTAQQVHDILFRDQWYKVYLPDEVAANAVPTDIGETRMPGELSNENQRYSIRYIDGPLMADDGTGIQISVAVCNDGHAVWTSNSSLQGGLEINVASHIIDDQGLELEAENPRFHIPFAMPPGQEMVFPVRVSSDWLARGAHHVDVVMVQEGARRFGTPARFALNQRPASLPTTNTTSSLTCTKLDLLKGPWLVPGIKGRHLLLAVSNVGTLPISTSHDNIMAQLEVRYAGIHSKTPWRLSVTSAFAIIQPGQIGLLTLTLPDDACRLAEEIHIVLGGKAGASLIIAP